MRATAARTQVKLIRARPAATGLVEIEVLARDAGIHPELARRLVRLGLVEPAGGTAQVPLFRPGKAALLARAIRLHHDLGIDYAGAVLASELLARIDELEERLRRFERLTNRKG